MRDHNKLRAFQLADELAMEIYRATATFPRREMFGLVAQMRRAAVSVPSNIVEGCARHTRNEYLRFLDMAFGSTKELGYQIGLASRLGYVSGALLERLRAQCEETAKVLAGLIRSHRSDGS
jgi:four helix bundle protein